MFQIIEVLFYQAVSVCLNDLLFIQLQISSSGRIITSSEVILVMAHVVDKLSQGRNLFIYQKWGLHRVVNQRQSFQHQGVCLIGVLSKPKGR